MIPAPAAPPAEAFPPSLRVRRRVEFLRAQKSGRRQHVAHFTVIFFDRGEAGPPRLGLVTSRKIGNAVHRNGVRRRLRECFRRERARFPQGHDVVVIAREGAPALDYAAVRDEMLAAVAKRRAGPGGPRRAGGATPP